MSPFPKTLAEVGTNPKDALRDLEAFRRVGSWPETPGGRPEWLKKMEARWAQSTGAPEAAHDACVQEAWRMIAREGMALAEQEATLTRTLRAIGFRPDAQEHGDCWWSPDEDRADTLPEALRLWADRLMGTTDTAGVIALIEKYILLKANRTGEHDPVLRQAKLDVIAALDALGHSVEHEGRIYVSGQRSNRPTLIVRRVNPERRTKTLPKGSTATDAYRRLMILIHVWRGLHAQFTTPAGHKALKALKEVEKELRKAGCLDAQGNLGKPARPTPDSG